MTLLINILLYSFSDTVEDFMITEFKYISSNSMSNLGLNEQYMKWMWFHPFALTGNMPNEDVAKKSFHFGCLKTVKEVHKSIGKRHQFWNWRFCWRISREIVSRCALSCSNLCHWLPPHWNMHLHLLCSFFQSLLSGCDPILANHWSLLQKRDHTYLDCFGIAVVVQVFLTEYSSIDLDGS